MLTPPDIDFATLRQYRLDRLRQQLRQNDISMAILTNPVSMRYAVDLCEYQLFQSHIPMYYLFVAAEGPVILYGASPMVANLVDEIRPATFLTVFDKGFDLDSSAKQFAHQVKDFLKEIGSDNTRIACERFLPSVYQALNLETFDLIDAEPMVEKARMIKSAEEMTCMRYAIDVAEYGIDAMKQAMHPGMTENQLFAILHQINIAHGGQWIDGRMLCSGIRTNPWFQEASDKIIQDGELVAFDTDMVGPFGYCADISRTFFCGDAPSAKQRQTYQLAYEEVQHNIALIRPGMTFKELSNKALVHDSQYIERQYVCVAHGVGLTDEYPKIYYPKDWQRHGYDGVIEPNIVLSVESYVGSIHGGEGVKLEDMVLVTDSGIERLSSYPFEEKLL